MQNQVDHPKHYMQGAVECIDAIQSALTHDEFIGFLKGQELKYVWRAGRKLTADIITDLAKAKWYNEKLQQFILNARKSSSTDCNSQLSITLTESNQIDLERMKAIQNHGTDWDLHAEANGMWSIREKDGQRTIFMTVYEAADALISLTKEK